MCAFCAPFASRMQLRGTPALPARAPRAVLVTEHAAKHAHPVRASRAEHSLLADSLPILIPSSPARPRHHIGRVRPLAATLMDLPASVANKRLTEELSPLDATLTKNTGWEAPRHRLLCVLCIAAFRSPFSFDLQLKTYNRELPARPCYTLPPIARQRPGQHFPANLP